MNTSIKNNHDCIYKSLVITFMLILLSTSNLFSQIEIPKLNNVELSAALFNDNELKKLGITAINCFGYYSLKKPFGKFDTLIWYSLKMDSKFRPLYEDKIDVGDIKIVTNYFWNNSQCRVITKANDYLNKDSLYKIESDIKDKKIFKKITYDYLTNNAKSGYDHNEEYFFYNKDGEILKGVNYFCKHNNVLDSVITTYQYDDKGYMIQVWRRTSNTFSSNLNFAFGCLTPVLEKVLYKFGEKNDFATVYRIALK